MFTKEQIDEIYAKINALSRRDSDLPAARPLKGDEFVPLLQEAENRNASLVQVAEAVSHIVEALTREELYRVYYRGNVVIVWTLRNAIAELGVQAGKVTERIQELRDAADSLDGKLGHQSDFIGRLGLLDVALGMLKRRVGELSDLVERLLEYSPAPQSYTLTISAEPSDALIYIDGEERSTITVDYGTTVGWAVGADGYVTQSGSITITEDVEMHVKLVPEGKVYSDVEITEFYYDDIPASGGTATPTLKYRQTWGYGSETGGGVIEDGAEVTYEGVEGDGSHTEGSLGTTERERTQVATASVTVTLNGKTATASAEVWQAENKVEEYYGLKWLLWEGEMDVTYDAKNHSVILSGYDSLQYRRYSSGSTDNFYVVPNGHTTYSDVEPCDWARATSTGFTLDENTSTEMRGPYDNIETCESEGETISRVRHVYQEGIEEVERTITFNVSPTDATLTVNGSEVTLSGGTYTMTAHDGDVIEWSCGRDGYASQNGTHTVDGDAEINIALEEGAHYITVIPVILTLTGAMNSNVTVSSDGAWTAATDSDWLLLGSVSGEAGVTTVSVGASVTVSEREGTVIFTSEYGDTATLLVRQAPSSSGGGGTGGTTYIYAVVNNTSSDVELYLFDEKGLESKIATVPANETVTITTDKEITSESEFYVSGSVTESYTVRVQGATIYIDYGTSNSSSDTESYGEGGYGDKPELSGE